MIAGTRAGQRDRAFALRAVEQAGVASIPVSALYEADPVSHILRLCFAKQDAVLDEAGQMLPCEPPEFAGQATVGGAVASGLSGPRRPWVGAVRDFVLGARIVSGTGEDLSFGGRVIK